MNRWFNAMLWLFAILYFGQILVVLLYSPSFPIGAAGSYDLALRAVFAENGDVYNTNYSNIYWTFYYLDVAILIASLILLVLRRTAGIWLFLTFIGLEVLLSYWINANTVVVAHKTLIIAGAISYPLQGAIIALCFASSDKLGFKRAL